MASIDEHGRPEPLLTGDEWETLTTFLDWQRATFAWKTSGLSAAQLTQPLHPTAMTLGGLMKHLAYVEDEWFGHWLEGEPRREPWTSVDWTETPDWEFESAAYDAPEALKAMWEQAIARARAAAEAAYAANGLEQVTPRTWSDGAAPSLRWILVHMIEEYARHNGHADLLREAIDGQVGE